MVQYLHFRILKFPLTTPLVRHIPHPKFTWCDPISVALRCSELAHGRWSFSGFSSAEKSHGLIWRWRKWRFQWEKPWNIVDMNHPWTGAKSSRNGRKVRKPPWIFATEWYSPDWKKNLERWIKMWHEYSPNMFASCICLECLVVVQLKQQFSNESLMWVNQCHLHHPPDSFTPVTLLQLWPLRHTSYKHWNNSIYGYLWDV